MKQMKVADLIAALSELDPTLDVMFNPNIELRTPNFPAVILRTTSRIYPAIEDQPEDNS